MLHIEDIEEQGSYNRRFPKKSVNQSPELFSIENNSSLATGKTGRFYFGEDVFIYTELPDFREGSRRYTSPSHRPPGGRDLIAPDIYIATYLFLRNAPPHATQHANIGCIEPALVSRG